MEYNIRFTLDSDLKNDFNDLNKYHLNSDYFNSVDSEIVKKYKYRFDGIKKGDKLGDTGMNILEIPARKLTNTSSEDYKENNVKCPLCLSLESDKAIYPFNLEKSILWRGYLIRPNGFPYFRLHYLIQSSDHNENTNRGTQNDVHLNSNIISDILTFLKIMNKGSALFNGWIGNSLAHMHFHYTDMNFPIKQKLKKYLFNKEIIKTSDSSTIFIYKDTEHNCKNFIFIKGTNPSNDVFHYLQYLNSINLLYNLLMYYNNNMFHIFIYIRKKEVDDYKFNFGATNLSGLTTLSESNFNLYKDNKNNFLELIENYCSKTVIKMDLEEVKKIFSS